MRIYTRSGDTGETGLFGGGRVPKDSGRVEAYGTIDELNATLGVARNFIQDAEIDAWLEALQRELFLLGADLATPLTTTRKKPVSRLQASQVTALEEKIDAWQKELPPLTRFLLPGGTPGAAFLHLARTICRRAERRVVKLAREESINPEIIRYLNRLSDLLFVLARLCNQRAGQAEHFWE
ncbi:MAG: cob(I)yrinic acid a,c-diamide adenosyltransferase [Nitrospinota bacterium]|nr:MAG: cob(I)yrinic acid a,c-diamide adenosyltransferase [Nitrospinota bacterium]